MNEKKPMTGMGALSVVTVLLVLVFTMFAVLAQSGASASLRLSQKTADSTTAYYAADREGQALLARLDALPDETREQVLAAAAAYAPSIGQEAEGPVLSCTIPGREGHILEVRVGLTKPLKVLEWRWSVAADTMPQSGNTTLPVWQGKE